MLYITMLRCRQKEKLACLTHYNSKIAVFKDEEKVLKKQIRHSAGDKELTEQLIKIRNESLEVKRFIINLEMDMKDNNYHIEMEEAKLAREASRAKARVMESKINKNSDKKLKSQMV